MDINLIKPFRKKIKKHPGGRPTVMTPEVIAKLEQVFAIDGSVEEALSYADIGRNSFYDYLKRNKEFSNRIEDLRQRPILKARQTIVKNLNDPIHSKWYLERKRKNEFAERQEMTGKDGNPLLNMQPIAEALKKMAEKQYDPTNAEFMQSSGDAGNEGLGKDALQESQGESV